MKTRASISLFLIIGILNESFSSIGLACGFFHSKLVGSIRAWVQAPLSPKKIIFGKISWKTPLVKVFHIHFLKLNLRL